eukprot:9480022-Pyramimonas_sp.AAC.1
MRRRKDQDQDGATSGQEYDVNSRRINDVPMHLPSRLPVHRSLKHFVSNGGGQWKKVTARKSPLAPGRHSWGLNATHQPDLIILSPARTPFLGLRRCEPTVLCILTVVHRARQHLWDLAHTSF